MWSCVFRRVSDYHQQQHLSIFIAFLLSLMDMSTDSDSFVNIPSEESKTDSDTALTGTSVSSKVKSDEKPVKNRSASNDQADDMANSWQDLEQEAIRSWVQKSQLSQAYEKRKIHREISKRNVKQLQHVCLNGNGLVSDDLRRMAWPLITETSCYETSPTPDRKAIESHPCHYQVCMDVDRSIKRFPPSVREVQRLAIQERLVTLIMRLLISNPSLHYYQGFHDVCVTFLLIVGEEQSFNILNSLTKSHLREFLEPTMEKTSILLETIPLVIKQVDNKLFTFLEKSGVGTIFALSWVITWFSHVLKNYDNVGRMFDFFISADKSMPLYFSAALLLYRKERILSLDCDMASVHQYLSRLVEEEEDDLPFEKLINDANHLFATYKVSYDSLLRRYEIVQPAKRPVAHYKWSSLGTMLKFILGHKRMVIVSFVVVLVASFVEKYYRNRITQ